MTIKIPAKSEEQIDGKIISLITPESEKQVKSLEKLKKEMSKDDSLDNLSEEE